MFVESKKYREERATKIKESQAILDAASNEDRVLTDEENEKWEKFHTDIDSLTKSIDQVEKQYAASKHIEEKLDIQAQTEGKSIDETDDANKKHYNAFISYLKNGMEGLSSEERAVVRAQSVGTDTAGGFLSPQEFSNRIEEAMLAFGGMMEVAEIFNTAKGGTLDYPEVNDTANQGRWLAENTTVTTTDMVFANNTFSAYKASSDQILVSVELLQDSFFDLSTWLPGKLGERLGRLANAAYTVGDGSAKPTGIDQDSVVGVYAAADDAVTFDEVYDLQHSVDPAYRTNGTFMFNDSTLKAIRKLKDGNNNYLWQPSNIVGVPDSLLGDKFVINQDVASFGLGAKSMFYGNLSAYKIRNVAPISVLRLDERYADNHQVGYLAFMRTDGKLIDAGTNPVKHLRNSAT